MQLFGLFGEKLGHSYSAIIHEKLYDILGWDASYKLLELATDQVELATKALPLLGYSGVNVTIPYKEKVMAFLDELDDSAKKTSAVNTIKVSDQGLIGYNTDYFGFKKLLADHDLTPGAADHVLVLGYGGAAKAIIALLKDLGVKEITVAYRAEKIAGLEVPGLRFISYAEANQTKADLAINMTPVGMYPHPDHRIVEPEAHYNYKAAIDAIYNPTSTLFLQDAEASGAVTVNGMEMLVNQAIKAVEIWTDQTFDDQIYDDINAYMIELMNQK